MTDLATMAALQTSVLRAAKTVVSPGGLLIYSTCSLEPEENEEQVESFLGENAGWRLEPPPAEEAMTIQVPRDLPNIFPPPAQKELPDELELRVLPHVHGSDGAFAARLRWVE